MGPHRRSRSSSVSSTLRLLACGTIGVGVLFAAVVVAPGPASAARHGKASGPVDVLYAGSLVNLMELGVGPAYDRATGYTFNGFAAGSSALANEIKGGTQQADVFLSASPQVNGDLEGPANGNHVSWYARFATSPLVLGYNKNSRFAADLKSKPWYRVITEPGFLLGRTDPAVDPKGTLAVEALSRAAATYHDPSLNRIRSTTTGVFPEETLVARLQSGQLDAGFFYSSEAAAAHIPTIGLEGVHLSAEYTVTVVNDAPHVRAAKAFLAFLLGPAGRSLLERGGLSLAAAPTVTGSKSVPDSLRSILQIR